MLSEHSGKHAIPRGANTLNEQTRFIGVPRFRQVRSRELECDVPDDFRQWTGVCFDTVDPSRPANEDRADWGPHLRYHWASEDALQNVAYWGSSEWYPGSGYVVNMPPIGAQNASDASAIIERLQSENWIDAKTRIVFVEFR
jgi:hypothetical protein